MALLEQQTNLNFEQMGQEMDQKTLLERLAEMGPGLKEQALQLISNPEAFIKALEKFETMKAETLAVITELFGKVDAAGRERLLAAKELLMQTKLVIEALSKDALAELKTAGAESAEIAGGILRALFNRKTGYVVLLIAAFIVASCGAVPPVVKTAVAPQEVHALGNGTPTATLNAPITKEPTRPTNTLSPAGAAQATATARAEATAQGNNVTPDKTPVPDKTPTGNVTVEIKKHGDTFINFTGEVNFNVEKKANVEVADDLFIRRWTPVTLENGQIIAVVTVTENPELESLYILLSSTGSSSLDRQLTDSEIDSLFNPTLKASGLDKTGSIETTFATGNTAEKVLLFNNPFANILEGNLADRMITFAETGDTSVLPKFNGIPYPVVFSYGLSWPSSQ